MDNTHHNYSTELQLSSSQYLNEEKYWLNKLSGDFIKSCFPYDHSDTSIETPSAVTAMSTMEFKLAGELFAKLKKITRDSDIRLHIILTTALISLLWKYTGNNDIVVGIPVYKQEIDAEFINTILTLKNTVDEEMAFKELLFQVRQDIIRSNENANYPIETLLYQLKMSISENVFPLFDTAVLLENIHDKRYLQHIHLNSIFSFLRKENYIEVRVDYNPSGFKEAAIERIISHYRLLLQAALFSPDVQVGKIEILSEQERKQVIFEFNQTSADYPGEKTLHMLFEEQAARTPGNTALVFEDKWLSYKEFHKKSNQLARVLRERGVVPDTMVGIMIERSIEMITGIFAVLKAGGAYLPISPKYPTNRIISIQKDSQPAILLIDNNVLDYHSFSSLQDLSMKGFKPRVTGTQQQITNLDNLSFPDRSLVNYEKYNRFIGHAMVKNSMALQATRGCPYNCAYCHKIWPKKHVVRSAENICAEVQLYYNMGVRRFVFLDDIFNLNLENSKRFFELLIEKELDVQLFFPNGIRGDILTREYIDLMVEAGVVSLAFALETASPRLQKLIKKNLDLEKLHKNIDYICKKYPHVILELFTMHGFPTETKEEALMTLDFIKSLKWLHFPYVLILKIYPNTDMEKLAIENGVSKEAINKSAGLAYHELPDTLPFEKSFTLTYQTGFLNEYFLLKERLLQVLPYQMKVLSEDEIVQKYNSYLPVEIKNFSEFLDFVGIKENELDPVSCLDEKSINIPHLDTKIRKHFPPPKVDDKALRVLLLDLSQLFSKDSAKMIYDVVEPPLGLMYLMTYLKREFGDKINGKIAKSRIDFDDYRELEELLYEFKPDVIGIRTLTFYKDFFHQTAATIRKWGIHVPIITGGPYATSDYQTILHDKNIDLVIRGEGELVFSKVIEKIRENDKKMPTDTILAGIAGLAFVPRKTYRGKKIPFEFIFLDTFAGMLPGEPGEDPGLINMGQSTDLAYVIYTSGSTGKPKGVTIEHRSVVNRLNWMQKRYPIGKNDLILQKTPFTFDVSVWELFWWALQGASLCLLGPGDEKKPDAIIAAVERNKITVMHFVPSMLNEFLEYIENTTDLSRLASLRQVFASGEALDLRQVEKFNILLALRNKTKLANLYGPTEATVDVTYFDCCAQEQYKKIPIGKPIDNIVLYIVNKNLQLLSPGSVGELCISGDGLARGYLNRIELTKEKFPENPFRPGANMYRTGDLVRWLPDGNIEFLGRKDHQVKIRGYRIELGEIESKLLTYPPVKEAAVVLRESNNKNGDQILSAYVIPDSTRALAVRQLLRLEKQDIKNKHLHDEFPNGMTIFYINRKETEFMYKEIFTENSYIKNGITLNHDDCIFDVGANIGLFALYVNQICSGAKIYAFEPVPQVFELLSLNTAIYGKNIKVFNYGISSTESEAIFSYYPHATFLSGCFADREEETMVLKTFITNEQSLEKNHEILSDDEIDELLENRMYNTTIKCNMKTLSQVIKENQVDKIDLLKIDVEKSEIEVLKGIRKEDWSKISQLVIEVHDIDGRLKWITDLLNKQGYNVKIRQDKELKNTCLYNVYAISPRVTRGEDANKNISLGLKGFNRWISPGQLVSELQRFLKEDLPHYMVPANILLMDSMPLTPGGKIDRKSLPIIASLEVVKNYVKPRNEVEKKLVEIWSDVLGVGKDRISIDANFFESGGHSLKAITVISRISKAFNVKILLADLFNNPTIRGLSGVLGSTGKNKYVLIEPVEKKEYFMLSSAQTRLYILNKIEYLNTAYNVSEVMILEGHLNKVHFEEVFRKLIKRHEILRTSFKMLENEPIQEIHDNLKFEIEYYDIPEVEKEEGARGLAPLPIELAESTITDFIRPFDLAAVPLMRVGLTKLHEKKHILMFDMHHIISDGTSINTLVKEFMAFYKGEDLPVLRIQYKDFSHWQNNQIRSGQLKKQEDYWLEEFKTGQEIPVLELPTDYTRPGIQSFDGSTVNFEVRKGQTAQLKQFALEIGTTMFMVLLVAFNLFLSKLSGQEDIVIGSPVAGRTHNQLESIMGMFVNTLALRNYPAGDKTCLDFLQEVKSRFLKALENQEYQYEELVEKAVVNRDLSANPLFNVMMILQNMERKELAIPGLKIKPFLFENKTSKFDMTFEAEEKEDKLYFAISYNTSLFKNESILRFTGYFKKILSDIIEDPRKKISEIEIISEKERYQILYKFNDTKTVYSKDKTIHELFEEQVERVPDNTALLGSAAECTDAWMHGNMFITYGELNDRSDQLADLLVQKGIRADTIIGLMLERSLEMIIGIFGILKAGGAYLPIDPEFPGERIRNMLTDSSVKVLIAGPKTRDKVKVSVNERTVEFMDIYSLLSFSISISNSISTCRVSSTNLAYVIFTSGSIGRPKGVMITHRNVINFINGITLKIPFEIGNAILALTTISFDIFVLETLLPLTRGLKIIIANEQQQLDLECLKHLIRNNHVNMIQATPSRLILMMEDIDWMRGVSVLMVGGEAFPYSLFSRLKKKFNGQVVNLYGPTETTVWSTLKDLTRGKPEEITIGGPIANTRVYILDKDNHLQPIGVVGELGIGGDGVARGYLNSPELTVKKFVRSIKSHKLFPDNQCPMTNNSPHSPYPPNSPSHSPHSPYSTIYKTGDLAKWLPDNNIAFLGRIDYQVKIRGFRIELGEIESQLLKYEEINEAVVVVKANSPGDNHLYAYIVLQEPAAAKNFNISELRRKLALELPLYMIPTCFVALDNIPVTVNGKIDRKMLPNVEGFHLETNSPYVEPKTNLEKQMAQLWQEVLHREEKIGLEDNFFDLGGNSFNVLKLNSKLNAALHINIPLITMFRFPTIRSLLNYIIQEEPAMTISTMDIEIDQSLETMEESIELWDALGEDKND